MEIYLQICVGWSLREGGLREWILDIDYRQPVGRHGTSLPGRGVCRGVCRLSLFFVQKALSIGGLSYCSSLLIPTVEKRFLHGGSKLFRTGFPK